MNLPIFVINLDKRTDRLQRMTTQLLNHGLLAYRVSGEIKNTPVHGCTASHIKTLNFIKQDSIILEDDAVLCSDFSQRVEYIIENVPDDWDHCYLAGGCLGEHEAKLGKMQEVKKYIFTSVGAAGTYAYMVRGKSALKMAKLITYDRSVDDEFCRLIETKKIKSYIFLPTCAKQTDGDFSDILGYHLTYPAELFADRFADRVF